MRRVSPIVTMIIIFVSVYILSIMLTNKFQSAGIKAFEEPNNPINVLYFFFILVIVTISILLISRLWKKEMVQIFILFAVWATVFPSFQALFHGILPDLLSNILSILLASTIVFLLLFYPEWYVIDLSALILSVGAVTIFGISLSVPLVVSLLTILALYDAISVYKTKHMIDLADTVIDLKLPVIFIVPHKLGYKFRKQAGGIKRQIMRKERDAFFVGVGDVVIPGMLVISSYSSTSSIIVSLSIILGIVLGFIALMILVSEGKPHAGLPFLNAGAIMGYAISSLIIYGHLVGFAI